MSEAVDPEMVRRRVDTVRRTIAELTDRQVRIVGVTKTHPDAVVAAALRAGLGDLAENYAQALRARGGSPIIDAAGSGPPGTDVWPRWHFIGRLQSNKVRLIADLVWCWQTVDRLALVEELVRRAPGARVMVQVDIAGIPDRGGCRFEEVPGLVSAATDSGLEVVGLMAVGTPGPPEASRDGFRRLVEAAEDLGLPDRSIGMSGDYRVAVEEGSTVVRLGRTLFGPRDP